MVVTETRLFPGTVGESGKVPAILERSSAEDLTQREQMGQKEATGIWSLDRNPDDRLRPWRGEIGRIRQHVGKIGWGQIHDDQITRHRAVFGGPGGDEIDGGFPGGLDQAPAPFGIGTQVDSGKVANIALCRVRSNDYILVVVPEAESAADGSDRRSGFGPDILVAAVAQCTAGRVRLAGRPGAGLRETL